MAKKKEATLVTFEEPKYHDNHSPGVAELPNSALKGYDYENQMFFPGQLADGESPNTGDVNVATANGISSSKGQGKDMQYNWHKGLSGSWNKNDPWDGGNLTGL